MGSDPTSDNITYETLAAPTVTALNESYGPETGGTAVTVTGTNFFRADGITSAITGLTLYGDVPLSNIISAPDGTNTTAQFTFITPPMPAGANMGTWYPIIVTTAGGSSNLNVTSQNAFEYLNVPVVTAIKWTAGGGAEATYVKAGDIVFIYADYICGTDTALIAGVNAVKIDGTPVTSRQAVVCSGTSGYVEVVLPAKPLSMSTQYSVTLSNDNGESSLVSAVKLVYPPEPTFTNLQNIGSGTDYGAEFPTTGATLNAVITGRNFKTAATGANLVTRVYIDANTTVSTFTVSPTLSTSITGVTIPSGLSVGAHTITVETYGGVSNAFSFTVLVAPTITSPTTNSKAYMWTTEIVTANPSKLEPFNITGTGFYSDSVVEFRNASYVTPSFSANAKTASCSYVSSTSITGCDINRTNASTAANTETEYTLTVSHPLYGTASQSNSIRVEQISPTAYQFVGGNQFSCSNLINYNFPNSSASTYHTALVTDTRNGQAYRVRKLADGRCWMIDNMKIDNYNATTADSAANYNIPVAVTLDVGVSYSIPLPIPGRVWDIAYICDSITVQSSALIDNRTYMPHSQTACGHFYNIAAALGVANFANVQYVATSICPAGWMLPFATGTDDFATLGAAMVAAASTFPQAYRTSEVQNWYQDGAWSAAVPGIFSVSAMGVGDYSPGYSNSTSVAWWHSARTLGNQSSGLQSLMLIPPTVHYTDWTQLRRASGVNVRCLMS